MRGKLLLLCGLAVCGTLHAADQPPLEVSSPHFTLITDGGDKQARHVLDNFERMRWMFHTLFPNINVDPPAPIVVMAMKNKKGFQALEPQEYLAKGQLNLAGLFMAAPEKNYVLLRLDAESEHPFASVYHEYTHLQFRNASQWMPLWLNEGLAEFYQNTDFHDKEVLLGKASLDDIYYLRENQIIPLETLFRVDHNSPYYHEENKGSVFYSESWALTHYLMVTDRQKGVNRLGDYMVRMSKHEDPVTGAQEAFGDLKQLQKALGFYIVQQQYMQFGLSSAAAPNDPASYKVRVLTQPQYDADRADFLAYVDRTQDARNLLTTVMAADPKNAQARETMGYLELRAGNQEAARKWYGEAVQLDSQSYLANYYFAAMSMSSGHAEDPGIEASLRAAIHLNPNFAPPYDLLAGWYANQHKNLDEAQTLEQKAVQLDLSNLNYRMNAANILEIRDNLDAAEQVLRASQKLAKTPQDALMIQSRLDQIASMQKVRAAASTDAVGANNEPVQTNIEIVPNAVAPKHPTEPANGPKHTVLGIIATVQCSYPTTLELKFNATGKTKPVALYTNDFRKIDLTVLGFTPKGSMDPCHELTGMKAKLIYAESSDKTVDGQVVSIELHK